MNSLLQTQWISKNPVGYIPAGKVEKRIPAKNSQQIPKNTGIQPIILGICRRELRDFGGLLIYGILIYHIAYRHK
jgi:hypothetical protein